MFLLYLQSFHGSIIILFMNLKFVCNEYGLWNCATVYLFIYCFVLRDNHYTKIKKEKTNIVQQVDKRIKFILLLEDIVCFISQADERKSDFDLN